jgi:hypothetical protein
MSHLTFTQALLQAEAQACSTLDVALHARLSDAVSLVKAGRVFEHSAAGWQVESTSREGVTYTVNGHCPCADAHYRAPEGRCKHVLAVLLSRKVLKLMQAPAPAMAGAPPAPPFAPGYHGFLWIISR